MKVTLEQQQQGQELLQTLISKAWESAAFKEQLISNPEKSISEIAGKNIHFPNQKIVVEDQTDESIIYLNIHRKIDTDELELSDEQLEMVAGGEFVLAGATLIFTALMAGIMVGEKIK